MPPTHDAVLLLMVVPPPQVLRIAGRMAFMNATVLRDTLISFVDKEDLPYADVIFDCAGRQRLAPSRCLSVAASSSPPCLPRLCV